MSLSSTFLNEIAYKHGLSPDQRKVFLLRFSEDKDYEEIAQLLDTSAGACLKRMGQVYRKFDIPGDSRGKESFLQSFLIEEYKNWGTDSDKFKLSAINSKGYIIYTNKDTEQKLASELQNLLIDANHEITLFNNNIHNPKEWSKLINKFRECDYLVFLLSEQSAFSDLLLQQVGEIIDLPQSSSEGKPMILPIYLNFSDNYAMNHELSVFLQNSNSFNWRSPNDTPEIVQKIIALLKEPKHLNSINTEKYSENSLNHNSAKIDGQPLPVAYPEGQVDLSSNFYIERPPIESLCQETILQPGALISIKASRQMGKTSLMAKIIKYGEEQNYKIVNLTLQLAEKKVFSSLDTFLKWFCIYITYKLGLENRLDDYWQEYRGLKVNCTDYLEEYLLPKIEQPLILAIDELDVVFQYEEIASDFLAMLRTWHEYSKSGNIWKKLRLIICHSTEAYIPLDINQSPFNVGLVINLPEFTYEQVDELTKRYGLNWGKSEIEKLMKLVGGHPYLVRLGLYHIARKNITLEDLLQTATKETSIYSDHLRRQLWILSKYPELIKALKTVLNSSQAVALKPIDSFKLHGIGLVKYQNNHVILGCNLYQNYFLGALKFMDEITIG
jgi:AAA-like domain/Sigma-70, region 4